MCQNMPGRALGALTIVSRENHPYRLYARPPEEITRDLLMKIFGEKGKDFL
ncbi:MAG: hypothetical protein QXQ41_05465 [Candidatus Bathyarchaeia archaeon]